MKDTVAVPRWVKVFALVFVLLLALFALAHLTDQGFQHEPAASETMESGR